MEQKSFTLIELLAVIAIIGILAAVIVVSTSSSISDAKFAKAKAFSSTVDHSLLFNLVSEWNFDEDISPYTVTKDGTGNSIGTVHGATYNDLNSGNCFLRGCYSFGGDGDYIEISRDGLGDSLSSFSVSVWARVTGLVDWQYIVHRSATTSVGTSAYIISVNSSDYYVGTVNGRYSIMGTNVLADNNWRFLFLTYDGQNQKFYVDGELKATDVSAGAITNVVTNNTFTFGGTALDPTYRCLNGFIDEVKIYNKDLSSAQIRQEYVAGLNLLLNNKDISKEEYNKRLSAI